MAGPGYEARTLDQGVLVDIARAVREDVPDRNAHDELRLGPGRQQWIVGGDRRAAPGAKPRLPLEVDEQQADLARIEHGAERHVHPVAVVAGQRERARIE